MDISTETLKTLYCSIFCLVETSSHHLQIVTVLCIVIIVLNVIFICSRQNVAKRVTNIYSFSAISEIKWMTGLPIW